MGGDQEPLMHIDQAPHRVRREHYRRERIISTLVVLVLVAIVIGVSWICLR